MRSAVRDHARHAGPPVLDAAPHGARADRFGHGRRLPRRRAARAARGRRARSISSPAAASARSARCSPRSTAAPRLWERVRALEGAPAARFYRLARAAARRRLGARGRGRRPRGSRSRCSPSPSSSASLGLLLTLVGLEGPRRRADAPPSRGWIDTLFAPAALPTIIPRLVLFCAARRRWRRWRVGLVASARPRAREAPGARRHDVAAARRAAVRAPPSSIARRGALEPDSRRGAAGGARRRRSWPGATSSCCPRTSVSPGFASCCSSCTTWTRGAISSSRSWATAHRRGSSDGPAPRTAPAAPTRRSICRGVARDHALDALAAALALPVATEPHLVDVCRRRARGAARRTGCAIVRARSPGCSRKWRSPGAEQVILVAAPPPPAGRTS